MVKGMIYLLNGDIHQIKTFIDELIKKNNIDDININKYELDAYNYKDVLEDASSISLFEEDKMIIAYNALIFSSTKQAVDADEFIKYLENPNPNTTLIFVLEDNIDERKKITKLVRKIGIVKEFNQGSDSKTIIKGLLEDYKIEDDALNKFIELVPNDYYNIKNELDKLKLYKDDKLITLNDILNVTTNNIDVSLFKLMDYIMDNNKEKALELYNNMVLYNVDPIQIIIALANKYRLLYQVKTLYKLGYKEQEVSKELKQNPKYIFVLNKISQKYSKDYLLSELKKLADMDFKIKSGKIDSNIALELYILNNV